MKLHQTMLIEALANRVGDRVLSPWTPVYSICNEIRYWRLPLGRPETRHVRALIAKMQDGGLVEHHGSDYGAGVQKRWRLTEAGMAQVMGEPIWGRPVAGSAALQAALDLKRRRVMEAYEAPPATTHHSRGDRAVVGASSHP